MHWRPWSVGGLGLPRWRRTRPDAQLAPAAAGRRTLRLYLIKPSRYDDRGEVLEFRWGVIPNNTLLVLAGLADAYAAAHTDVALQTVLWDEHVDGALTRDTISNIASRDSADGVEVLFGVAGVQTNQYPRARDLALQCRRLALPVIAGGFHVSTHQPSRDFLIAAGVTVVVGEAETTFATLLDDYLRGALRPTYQNTDGVRARTAGGPIIVPPIGHAPLPALDRRYLARFFNPTFATIDTSRGCPFLCSYCSVKNVMGRTMRTRDPDTVVAWLRTAHDTHGVRNVLVVDDDFFRSPAWMHVLTGVAVLRRAGQDLSLVLQTDIEAAFAHTNGKDAAPTPAARFVDLAAAAGCFEVFMGLESFDPDNLEETQKFHNEARQDRRGAATDRRGAADRGHARYRAAIDAWHGAGVGVHCGYMIGLPHDDIGCGARAARALTEIGVDIATFFVYTPFPGTEDYDTAAARGQLLHDDFNDYDSTHAVWAHPRLTPSTIEREYADAYGRFYTWRRLAWSLATGHRVPGLGPTARAGMLAQQVYFTYAARRGVHPMMGGIWRRRTRGARRVAASNTDAARSYEILGC